MILILIAIVVPLAVLLPTKKQQRPTVLIPLYIYPSNGTWQPLYRALEAYPDQQFMVIVNPSSGPGSSAYPNEQYIRQIERLGAYSNAQPIGYIPTEYATRDIDDVLSDVSTYAGWAMKSEKLAMYGIFFDEAPVQFSAAAVGYMRTINEAVKNANGLQGNRTVIHNPGTIPDPRYSEPTTDITVICENSYSGYENLYTSLAELPKYRSEYSLIIHSIPEMSTSDLGKFVDQLGGIADYLYITSNTQNYYESFGSLWGSFVELLSN